MKRTSMFFLALLVFMLLAPCMAGKAETGTIAISANENIKEYDPLYLSEEDYEIYSGILKRLNAEYGFHLGFTQEDMSRDSDSYVLLFSPEEFESKMREAILAKRAQNPNAVYLFDTTAVPEDECLFTEADVDKRVAFIDNCYMSSEAIAEYQAINDKINGEYGIFTCFVPEMFMPGNPHRPLASYTLAEYEAELRRDVETIIQNNKETEEYKRQLTDTDIIYYSSDIKRVEINAEISVFSHTMDECCAAEDMPEQMILDTNNHFCLETSEREDCDDLESQNRTAVKTIDGVQFMDDQRFVFTELDSYNSGIENFSYYRAALRVGYVDSNENGRFDAGVDIWDYHWFIQLGDGSWADKRGSYPSRIVPNSNVYTNPQAISWNVYELGDLAYSQFYNSSIVYYSIAR